MENYRYLPSNHHVCRLLASFTDVDRCETCKNFTEVKPCSTCSKGQCESCFEAHADEQHRRTNQKLPNNTDRLTADEREILELIRDQLTEKEFEDCIETARLHLHAAVLNGKQKSARIPNDEPVDRLVQQTQPTPTQAYDWSKHERFTADDILYGTPERVKHLLRLAFTPRPYQIRMTRAALKKANSLVCLQTGAGKTNVSASR
jgi:superfamily II RNA helicase